MQIEVSETTRNQGDLKMTDQTQIAPASSIISTIWNVSLRLAGKFQQRMRKPHEAPYKPAKRFSAGLSPDMVAFDWGHLQGFEHDRFRRF